MSIITKLTMKDLLDSGMYIGHLTRFYNPTNINSIYQVYNKLNIINLEVTLDSLQKVIQFLSTCITENKVVLFVGTKRSAKDLVEEFAEKCGMPYVNYRWLGGMLTNYATIKQSVKRLYKLHQINSDGTFMNLTKKEGLVLLRELECLNLYFCGIKNMKNLPDVIIVVDVGKEYIAVKEAKKMGIPVIGLVDTNNSVKDITYVVPGNDDSIKSIRFFLGILTDTIIETRNKK